MSEQAIDLAARIAKVLTDAGVAPEHVKYAAASLATEHDLTGEDAEAAANTWARSDKAAPFRTAQGPKKPTEAEVKKMVRNELYKQLGWPR